MEKIDFGGGGGHGGASPGNDIREYGKWVFISTLIVLASVAVVLWMI